MAAGFSVTASVALAAATAKTALSVTSAATRVPILASADISFNGTSSSEVPVLVELVAGTAATAGAATAFTPLQLRGDPAETAQSTGAVGYTAEPTALVALMQWYVSPTSGIAQQLPLGREVTGTAAAGSARKMLGIRCTASAAVTVAVNLTFDE